MTENKIAKKREVWLWSAAGIIILSLIIYILYSYTYTDEQVLIENAGSNETLDTNQNSKIDRNNIQAKSKNKMNVDESYSNKALLKLAAVTKTIADKRGCDLNSDIDKVRFFANKIINAPSKTDQAYDMRKATDILSTSIQKIQQLKFHNLSAQARELKEMSASISPDELIQNQKDVVRTFFVKAADLLQKMNK